MSMVIPAVQPFEVLICGGTFIAQNWKGTPTAGHKPPLTSGGKAEYDFEAKLPEPSSA